MPNKPVAVFYCGANGAGKSTLRSFNRDTVSLVIDSDRIAVEINPANPRAADTEAGRKAVSLYRYAVQNRLSFSMESTLSGVSVLRRMADAKAQGFCIILNYIGLCHADLHIGRVRERVRNGGHAIDEDLIRKRFLLSRQNLPAALMLADEALLFDNSADCPQLQLAVYGHALLRLPEPAEWVREAEQFLLQQDYYFADYLCPNIPNHQKHG